MSRNIQLFSLLFSTFLILSFFQQKAAAQYPAPYFLTPEEITDSRAGIPRNDINPYTLSGNFLDLLMNGDEFFTVLYHDLNATKEGDFIWITTWDIHKDVMLMPDPENPVLAEASKIQNILLAAIKRKVNVRILINSCFYNPFRALGFCIPLNKAAQQTVCAPDIRHNTNFGSLHQKTFVIKRNNETVAYTGGIDIAEGRYDNTKHDNNAKRSSQPPMPSIYQNYYGWSDGMLYMKGPVALDMARHLYQQFSDPQSPFPLFTFPHLDWPNPTIGFYNTNTQVQALFGAGPVGAQDGYYSDWAPAGELSILAAMLKAIALAKDYIFIADQFLWYAPILNALAEKVDQVKAIVLLTNPPEALDLNILGFNLQTVSNTKAYYQYKTWEVLLNKPNVFGYQMIKEGLDVGDAKNIIYSHWKVLLIDDRFAMLGTAGAEQASMVNDLEVNVGIFDPVQVTEIRKKLWGEFLNIPDPTHNPLLKDPVQSILKVWPEISAKNGRVRNFWPLKIDFQPIYKTVFNMFQPCGHINRSLCQE